MPTFSKRSKSVLNELHPFLQKVALAAILEIDFVLLDAQRGRAEQTAAYKGGFSKARFGESAHNYEPGLAFDLCPYPVDFDDEVKFIRIHGVITRNAKRLDVPLRWGADWNRNGKYTDEGFRDWGHYELDRWQDFAKHAKLLED